MPFPSIVNIVPSAGAIWMLQVRTMTRPESATTDTGYRGTLPRDESEKRNPQDTLPREIQVQALETPRSSRYMRSVECVGEQCWRCCKSNKIDNFFDYRLAKGICTATSLDALYNNPILSEISRRTAWLTAILFERKHRSHGIKDSNEGSRHVLRSMI